MEAELIDLTKVSIPNEILSKMGITKGDKFEVILKDGVIFLCPIVSYSKDKIVEIENIIDTIDEDDKVYDGVDDMFTSLGIELDEI